MTSPSPSTPRSSFKRRHWGKLTLAIVVLVPLAALAVWTFATLTYTYSSGPRVGYVQKLSRKGWLCKTWEGELAMSNVPGQAPEIFQFSVREDSVARQVLALEGARVALTYEQHKGVPISCFGETEYFATGVRRVNESGPIPGAAAVPAQAPAVLPAPAPAAPTPAPVPAPAP